MGQPFDDRIKQLIADYPDLRGDQMAYYLRMLFDIIYHDGADYRLRTSATGSFTPLGMNDFIVTTLDVSDTAIKLPTTALTGRKQISILNNSASVTLYIHKVGTLTADSVLGTTSGWPIFPQSILNEEIEGDIDIWAKAPIGQTIRVTVKESRII